MEADEEAAEDGARAPDGVVAERERIEVCVAVEAAADGRRAALEVAVECGAAEFVDAERLEAVPAKLGNGGAGAASRGGDDDGDDDDERRQRGRVCACACMPRAQGACGRTG